jgi:elongation factor Ts
MSVDAKTVQELREKTGLPMMECKRALVATGGDVQKAIDELRKSGAKAQDKLAGRKATEGRIASLVAPDCRSGTLVCVRCETDPVASNEAFQTFLGQVLEAVRQNHPKALDALLGLRLPSGGSVADGLTSLVNQLRENITIGGFAKLEGDAVGQYVHFDKKKAAMVSLRGAAGKDAKVQELAKDLCMHIVFSKPACLSKDKLDPAFVAKEREIILAKVKNDPRNASKPPQLLEKIVEGQFLKEVVASKCLLDQPYYRDDSLSVTKQLAQAAPGVSVVDFVYLSTDTGM